LSFIVSLKTFLGYKWWLDFLSNHYFGIFILKHSYETFYKTLDKGVFEILLINGLSFSIIKHSREVIRLQNGYIYSIICLTFIVLILVAGLSFVF
jgi:hypothetical protein